MTALTIALVPVFAPLLYALRVGLTQIVQIVYDSTLAPVASEEGIKIRLDWRALANGVLVALVICGYVTLLASFL